MKLYLTCLYVLPRWHIVAAFWRVAVSRVGTRQERRRICHFTLGGNPSRGTIVLQNRQEMVKHIILTRWALWHGQFYCCHRWKIRRKLLLVLPWEIKMLSFFSIFACCISASPCLCVWVGLSNVSTSVFQTCGLGLRCWWEGSVSAHKRSQKSLILNTCNSLAHK